MKGWVATTDFGWYRFLKGREELDEVDFWQPSGHLAFHAVPPGAPFFFKLKRPHNAICGFGFLARSSQLPDWLAWDAFGEKNGAPDYPTMRHRIEKYIDPARRTAHGSYTIGCLMVCEPVFFERDDWVAQPRDWARNIVRGKRYDLRSGEGRRIWEECRERARRKAAPQLMFEGADRFGEPRLVRPRMGQGTFRIAVTDAYQGACAVTAEHSLPVLEAAHIQPYAEGGGHRIDNGILLRSDVHALFDKGYVTITKEHRFEVGRHLREEWHNGRTYYELHGRRIQLPEDAAERPAPDLLAWHNESVFLG